MIKMNITDFVNYFNDGVADTGILMILVLIDTAVAVSYHYAKGNGFVSNRLLSGLIRNLILSFMPSLITGISALRPRSDTLYQYLAMILTIYIGYAIIQSILAYMNLWGVKLPTWLNDLLSQEIKDKQNKGK